VHVGVVPESVQVGAGQAATFTVSIVNTSAFIDAYTVRIFGLDPEWVTATPARLSLFPGDVGDVEVTVQLPEDYPASERVLAVDVHAENDPNEFALTQARLVIEPRSRVRLGVDPVMVQGGKSARFGLLVTNNGNATIHAVATGTDPEDLAEFVFDPPAVVVPPGRSQVIHTTASGGRAWFGQPRARVFELGVDTGEPVQTIATFIQRPRIGRWLLSLLGLLLAAAVFAAVLSRTFDQVVQEASVDDRLLEQALSSDAAGGAVVPINPAGITGSVISASTQTEVSGIQAELFLADDTNVPIASAATDGKGLFAFARLGEGTFTIRFSGAGFDSIWLGYSPTPADAAEVATTLGEVTELPPFELGARPGSVRGMVVGTDPVGAVVTLTVPGQLDPSSPALVASTEASADGSFFFETVPSPAVYRLTVAKPGFATETRDVVLRPAQALEGIEVLLRSGDGVIAGTVFSSTGPLGGATVVASDGSATIGTVSLTDGAVGSFTIRNLPTPGRYTVTISRDGYVAESRSVVLDTAQSISGFDATLIRAIGSIRGTVTIDGEGPAGGVTVSLSGGEVQRSTVTISQGAVGTFQFGQVPVPGTYTVTFSRAGLVSQVRLVDLDARAGRVDATGVDATLVRDRAVVRGTVVGPDDLPVARATVTLSDGTTELTFLTADDPAGEFEFAAVVPGAYTLSAERTGTTPVVNLVNVLASQVEVVELRLGAQASLFGQVVYRDPLTDQLVGREGVVVRLFLPGDFPTSSFRSAVTGPDGTYSFTGLDAPVDLVVAVFSSEGASEPLTSTTRATEPGRPVEVPDLEVPAP
jgi:hypothetical protein